MLRFEALKGQYSGEARGMTITREPALEAYLRDIGRVPLLTPEEEVLLAKRLAKGDASAREQMITANLRLVVTIARNYVNRGLALIGLLRAVEKFNYREQCRFSTYANWWIKQAIRRAITNTSKTVRVPAYMVDALSQWRDAELTLQSKLGRQPSVEEIIAASGVNSKSVRFVKRLVRISTSPSQPVSLDLLSSLNELIEDDRTEKPDQNMLTQGEHQILRKLLSSISPREAHILRLRYGLGDDRPMTLAQIGHKMKLTRERVRQIEREAITRLHSIINTRYQGAL